MMCGVDARDAMGMTVTFVVRVGRGPEGRLLGVVERVATGEKHRFEGSRAIGALIERMVSDEMPADGRCP
jgi:hypothetical protein